jgi:hypothetical protein
MQHYYKSFKARRFDFSARGERLTTEIPYVAYTHELCDVGSIVKFLGIIHPCERGRRTEEQSESPASLSRLPHKIATTTTKQSTCYSS